MGYGIFVRRLILGVSATFVLATVMGCMSLSIGERHESIISDDGSGAESGKLTIPAHQEVDVYYPAPYASTPNLRIESTWNDSVVVTQQPDHFRIKNSEPLPREVTWKARGVRGNSTTAIAVPVPVPPVPTTPAPTTVAESTNP